MTSRDRSFAAANTTEYLGIAIATNKSHCRVTGNKVGRYWKNVSGAIPKFEVLALSFQHGKEGSRIPSADIVSNQRYNQRLNVRMSYRAYILSETPQMISSVTTF